MDVGMLWFDDSSKPPKEKIRRAAEFYAEKYGRRPTVCLVHSKTLNGDGGSIAGIEVRKANNLLPHHFWIGVEEKKAGRKRRARKAAA